MYQIHIISGNDLKKVIKSANEFMAAHITISTQVLQKDKGYDVLITYKPQVGV